MKYYMFLKTLQKNGNANLAHCRCKSTLNSFPKRRFKVLDGKLTFASVDIKRLQEDASQNEQRYKKKLEQIQNGSSSSAIARHTKKNKKLLVRDRIKLLIDDDYPMLELGVFAGLGMDYGDIPSAGNVCAIAKISGQLCIILANDATIKGGTIFPIGLKKTLRCHEIAMQNNIPCFHYVDSGGAYLPLQADIFLEGGRAFFNEAVMNGMGIPQICIVAGSCTAGAAYIPTMANQVIMVNQIGSIFLAGPPLVHAAIGQKISEQDLGGATVHCEVSGVADYKAQDEIESIEVAKDVMSTLNLEVYIDEQKHVEEPFYSVEELSILSVSRDEQLRLDIPNILARLIDGSRFHQYKPTFGTELITGFARLNGILVGIVANYGTFSANACLKGTNFVTLCHQRGTPIIFLQDITGNVDDVTLIKPMSQLMSAVAVSTVPKITLILGNSYGVGNYAMCGRSMNPRFLFMWPSSRISIENQENLQQGEEGCEDIVKESDCYYSSGRIWDDGVILPQHTREVLTLSLNACLIHKPIEKLSNESTSFMRM